MFHFNFDLHGDEATLGHLLRNRNAPHNPSGPAICPTLYTPGPKVFEIKDTTVKNIGRTKSFFSPRIPTGKSVAVYAIATSGQSSWPVFAVGVPRVKKKRGPEGGQLKVGQLHPRRRHDREPPGEARVTVSTIFNFNSSNFFSGRGKKRFLSFVFLALFLALAVFAALLLLSFFALTNFYDNVETQKCFKWDSADILLCFNFFSAFVVKFSTCFPSSFVLV